MEMMHLEAICLGYAVPRQKFEAEVHSVFPSAANLRLVKVSRLLTLVTLAEADLPQGIRLDTPPGFSFEGLRPEARLACRDGILRCESAPLTVDLRPARRWKCDLPPLAAQINAPVFLAACRSAERALEARRARIGIGLPAGYSAAARKLDASAEDLAAATRRCDDLAAANAAAALVGLGPGLTPSGDDFLVGFLAGLWSMAGKRTEHLRFLASLGKAVVRLSRRTNNISRTYLFHAARGQVSSRLAALAGAICRGERPQGLLATAEAAMQIGHTSGMEAVSGLLTGLAAWGIG
jgi:hypothetical protein